MSTRLNMGIAVPGVRIANDGSAQARCKVAGKIGLAGGRVHELEGDAAVGFALSAASATRGLVFWVGLARHTSGLRARGLASFLDVSRLVTVQVADRREALWAGEEALRCSGAGLVVIQTGLGPDLFESRRLQVAAQTGGGLGLVLVRRRAQASAAESRWHCAQGRGDDGTAAFWTWRMLKNRRGQLREWNVRCERPPGLCLPPDLRPARNSPAYRPDLNSSSAPDHDPVPALATLSATPRRVVSPAPARPLAPA